ncbi:MAG: hypothetical protein HN742_07440 [Lentisphaerae bacterium]|jgi:hypothetical protein|nr:hypothetical protein [Lentisphaerota bacterium]MBT4819144.1 hypothetical protein [Lentisphaerota bacterium]MBT5607361.1 hypothetical protein [Lentisphaerota bacterium]MBT7058371.1 hypothetical protein [Lentisphaerota bacterium]MBT7841688.1 hypothetical protein [Lentisphaerota bacterium]
MQTERPITAYEYGVDTVTGKRKKSTGSSWQLSTRVAILCALCLCSSIAIGQDTKTPVDADAEGSALALKEAQVARQVAEERRAELSATLLRAEVELEQLRERYAELYLESRRQQQDREDLELRAAGLLADRQDISSGRALSRALNALVTLRDNQLGLGDQLREFGLYLNSVLDVLQPSEALRKEVTERYTKLVRDVDRSAKPLPIVAGRGSEDLGRNTCRVLTVEDELQVVLLDRGSDGGIRHGTLWTFVRDKRVIARLRVIDVRESISAAIVTDGSFESVGPGVRLEQGE